MKRRIVLGNWTTIMKEYCDWPIIIAATLSGNAWRKQWVEIGDNPVLRICSPASNHGQLRISHGRCQGSGISISWSPSLIPSPLSCHVSADSTRFSSSYLTSLIEAVTIYPEKGSEDKGSDISQILWNFCRYPPIGGKRITLTDNPHFYSPTFSELPIKRPDKYQDTHTYYPTLDFELIKDIYVLINQPGRVFLECGKNLRAFDNVWRVNGFFMLRCQYWLVFSSLSLADTFSAICGLVQDERLFGRLIQGRTAKWRRVPLEHLPSQSEVGSAVDLPNTSGTSTITCTTDTCTPLNGSSKWYRIPPEPLPSHRASMITCTTDTCTSEPAWLPVNDWREPIFHMLQSQEKIHIVFIESDASRKR